MLFFFWLVLVPEFVAKTHFSIDACVVIKEFKKKLIIELNKTKKPKQKKN